MVVPLVFVDLSCSVTSAVFLLVVSVFALLLVVLVRWWIIVCAMVACWKYSYWLEMRKCEPTGKFTTIGRKLERTQVMAKAKQLKSRSRMEKNGERWKVPRMNTKLVLVLLIWSSSGITRKKSRLAFNDCHYWEVRTINRAQFSRFLCVRICNVLWKNW